MSHDACSDKLLWVPQKKKEGKKKEKSGRVLVPCVSAAASTLGNRTRLPALFLVSTTKHTYYIDTLYTMRSLLLCISGSQEYILSVCMHGVRLRTMYEDSEASLAEDFPPLHCLIYNRLQRAACLLLSLHLRFCFRVFMKRPSMLFILTTTM